VKLSRLFWSGSLSVAVVSAACGGSAPPPTKAAPPPDAMMNQINPQPRDRVQDGGKLTWVLDSMPANFNYNQLDGTLYDSHMVMWSMLPKLFDVDATATPTWNKDYLASDPRLTTEPKQVVVYDLNPKATWSDGTPFTWEDLYWQWKALNGTDKRYQIAGTNGYDYIEKIERGENDRQAIVTFSKPFGEWKGLFIPLYPRSTNKDPKVFNEGWKARPLVTAGPFKFDSINRTSQTITVVRNDAWWGQRAKLDTIIFPVITPDAQIDALANGEIDFLDVASDVNKFNRAKALPGIEIRIAGGPNFSHITFNGVSTNLQDVRVRRAVAMSIDRGTIAKAMLGPLGLEPVPLGNHILMRNNAGYQDNSGEVGTFNPTKAAALLDEAGWKLENGVRRKDGRTLDITVVIPGGVATSKQIAELVQNMTGKVGIRILINTVPLNDFFEKYVTPGRFDLTFFSWMGQPFPISSSRGIFITPTTNDKGDVDVQQNYGRISSPEIDRLYDIAMGELDPNKAIEAVNKADAEIWREVHSLPIYQRPEIYPTKKNLANFGAIGFADWVYTDIGWMKP
jgi:peptide/nickel transport system substrate-binding protein